MKILQIVHGFPPEAIAGTERYCEALSRSLLARGYECTVLAGSRRRASQATLETVDQDGLLVTRYLSAEGRPHHWTEEYDPEAEEFIRYLLAAARPDLVHLHHWLYLTNNLAAICADMGIPVVVTLHDAWTTCPRIHRVREDGAFCHESVATAPCLTCTERSPWQDVEEIADALRLRREIAGKELITAEAVIVPSEAHRVFLLECSELPTDRLIVLPHGRLQTYHIQHDGRQERSGDNPRPLRLGHWGYLMYEKGTHLILEAVHRLRDPSVVEVRLIGEASHPEYATRLGNLARGITVHFHGSYQPADLELFDLDFAVFPSIASESYSFTLDEALCLGLPVVVPDHGALPERIGSAGLTFRAGDAVDLARRLQELLDAPEMLGVMRQGIRPEMLFSMEAHVAMVEKIYEDAVHARRSERGPLTPYVKLIAHARQQARKREGALADLQARLAQAEQRATHAIAAETAATALVEEREAERVHLQAEIGALRRSCQEATDRLAAREATAAALAEEREAETQARRCAEQRAEELINQLRSAEEVRKAQLHEREREISALKAERNDLMRRLTEFEALPAVRLQALLVRLVKGKR